MGVMKHRKVVYLEDEVESEQSEAVSCYGRAGSV